MRRATLPVLALLLLLSPPWSAGLAQGSSDANAARNALAAMYNHVLMSDGTAEFERQPWVIRYREASARMPADDRALLDDCATMMQDVWRLAGEAAQFLRDAGQAYDLRRTQLLDRARATSAEAAHERDLAWRCVQGAELRIDARALTRLALDQLNARDARALPRRANPAPLLEPVTFVRDRVVPVLKTGLQATLGSLWDRVLPVLRTGLQATLNSLLRGWTKGVESAVVSTVAGLVKHL